jgi:O-antigen ligase
MTEQSRHIELVTSPGLQVKAALFALCGLVLFLPFSAWLVSLSGRQNLSLVRDVFILVIGACSIPYVCRRNYRQPVTYAALLFCGWAILTFLWKQESALQWLKGFRFSVMPIVLFLFLVNFPWSDKNRLTVLRAVLGGALIIVLISVLQLLGVKVPVTTTYSGNFVTGALTQIHYVGGLGVQRFTSVLAGPNAFALYFLAAAGYCLWAMYARQRAAAVLMGAVVLLLLITFSRSSSLGLLCFVALVAFFWGRERFGAARTLAVLGGGLVLIALAFLGFYRNPAGNALLTHSTSSIDRVTQYHRIWDTREEIGLLGRGTGTAGPASQFRLDNGPNHWTENSYLDTFEETGLIGFALYLALIISLIRFAWNNSVTPLGRSAFILLASLSLTGLFINYYTGQVGIYLFWLMAALLVQENRATEEL